MYLPALLLLALLGSTHSVKLYSKPPTEQPPPPPPPQPETVEYYQQPLLAPLPVSPAQPLYREPVQQQSGVKGGSVSQTTELRQPEYIQQQQTYQAPSALAYVIIRPIQPQFQYLEPLRYNRPIYPTPIRPIQPIYRPPILTHSAGIKGQQQQEQWSEEQHPLIEQEREQEPIPQQPIEQPPPQPQPQQQPQEYPKGGKFLKLKEHFDQFAKKLTLGSTYQVQSEEIIQPQPQPQIVQQQEQFKDEQIHEQQVQQESFEQEPIRHQQQLLQPAKGENLQQQQQFRQEEVSFPEIKTRRPLELQQQQQQPTKSDLQQEQLNSNKGQF